MCRCCVVVVVVVVLVLPLHVLTMHISSQVADLNKKGATFINLGGEFGYITQGQERDRGLMDDAISE